MAITELLIIALIGASSASFIGRRSTTRVSGCGKEPHVALDKRLNATLSSGRRYLFWLPPDYDAEKETPLILSFHGATRTPESQADLDLLTAPPFSGDHIVVYPSSGEYGEKKGRYWQGAPHVPPDVDDVAYVLEILEDVESRFCVDTQRIYATGKSQGGLMTNNLACDARSSARIAAFAPVSGAYYVDVPEDECKPLTVKQKHCAPAREHIPMYIFHGGSDNTIPYSGGPHSGECLPFIPHFVAGWAERDCLGSKPESTGKLHGAGDNATVYSYGSGHTKDLVRLVYSGNHVDHSWPATVPNSDSVAHGTGPATFNASALILDFFSGYTLQGRV
ncbi:Alpha/Beta hydrolase protein [Xylaria arbuscula]|nr:Alpha/Beta hydrolase protein [Xylaria arbuscula]